MSCERYAGAIVDHACGAEIAPDARQHLESCEACGARFDEQRRMMDALDAELQTALAIEPSPYFDRKVHARIAQTAPASPRRFWWTALAAAAIAAIAVGLAAIRSTEDAAAVKPVEIARVAPPKPVTPERVQIPATQSAPSQGIIRATPPSREARTSTRSGRPRLPAVEVIVAADQPDAIARYLSLVDSGTLDTSNLAKEANPQGEPAPLLVQPLAIDPLTVQEVEHGTGPRNEREKGR